MEYRRLGKSGLKVSELGLGANNFGWWADEQTSIAVINHALDLGINYIDTADMYDRGRSEEFVGKALKGKRDRVIIATNLHYRCLMVLEQDRQADCAGISLQGK